MGIAKRTEEDRYGKIGGRCDQKAATGIIFLMGTGVKKVTLSLNEQHAEYHLRKSCRFSQKFSTF